MIMYLRAIKLNLPKILEYNEEAGYLIIFEKQFAYVKIIRKCERKN